MPSGYSELTQQAHALVAAGDLAGARDLLDVALRDADPNPDTAGPDLTEAAAILAKGNAEAQAMQSRADAFSAYGEAAVLDLLLTVLPQLVSAAAAPVGAIDKLTVISTDGASSLTKSVASTVAQGLQLGTDLTGVDLSQLLARLAQRSGERAATTAPDGRAVTTAAVTPSPASDSGAGESSHGR